MGANQRKTVLVILNVFYSDVPALHRVALFATRAHLAAVNVSMAVRASCADIGEDGFGVALGARNALVHAAQRITCLVVIEFRNCADRLPAYRCMTVLTGDVQISVRAARLSGHLRRCARRTSGEHRQRQHHGGQIWFQALPRAGELNSSRLTATQLKEKSRCDEEGDVYFRLCNSTPSQSTRLGNAAEGYGRAYSRVQTDDYLDKKSVSKSFPKE